MSISHDNAAPVRDDAKLTHELANLIDGSLRNVGLVLSRLRDDDDDAVPVDDALMQRLEAANGGLEQMAMILRRWMREHHATAALCEREGNLAQAVEHAARLLRPVAAAHGVLLECDIDEAAGALPGGPLYPVIANALRNAIDAIANDPAAADPKRVSLCCTADDNQLSLHVTDTGPGVSDVLLDDRGEVRTGVTTKLDGHGIGLTVAADIARSLGGSWKLGGRDPRGAHFYFVCPTASLKPSDPVKGT